MTTTSVHDADPVPQKPGDTVRIFNYDMTQTFFMTVGSAFISVLLHCLADAAI